MTSQLWADNLRLPCLSPEESSVLISGLSPPRQSIPFQRKHLPSLKRNVWFALKRPADRARTGYLCIIPERKLCIYVSGDPPSKKFQVPRVAILRIRVDPQFFEAGKPTVMEATLSARDRKLRIEDVNQWKGRILDAESFTARWSLAKQWLDHYCISNPNHLGFEIELAPWVPLCGVRPEGVWEFQEDDARKRRLRWISREDTVVPVIADVVADVVTEVITIVPINKPVAIASKPASAGPDQWDLTTSDGESLGRALIRTIDISKTLRETKQTVRLEVMWNSVFNKWEAVNITVASASSSEIFAKYKIE